MEIVKSSEKMMMPITPRLRLPTSTTTVNHVLLLWSTMSIVLLLQLIGQTSGLSLSSSSIKTATAPPTPSSPPPGPTSASAVSTTEVDIETQATKGIWGQAYIDYSAANTYMLESYGIDKYFAKRSNNDKDKNQNKDDNKLFHNNNNDNDDIRLETIYNARFGVMIPKGDDDDRTKAVERVEPTLASCGFCLVHSPMPEKAASSSSQSCVDNWRNEAYIQKHFLPRARHALLQAYAAYHNDVNIVHDILFWQPTLREGPTSYVAPVHIDMDMNAWASSSSSSSVDEMLDFVWKCRIADEDDPEEDRVRRKIWKKALVSGRRFSLTNVWHNIDPEQTATSSPLGLLRTEYSCGDDEDNKKIDENKDDTHTVQTDRTIYRRIMQDLFEDDANFDNDEEYYDGKEYSNYDSHMSTYSHCSVRPALPQCRPDWSKTKWYTFPNITSEELLLFTQYDRDARVTTDTWHCALTNPVQNDAAHITPTRTSFDVRCLVLLDDKVPKDFDRWGPKYQVPFSEAHLQQE